MEENFVKGVVADEALDEIAGGLNISKKALIAALTGVGVAVVAGATTATVVKKVSSSKTNQSQSQQGPLPLAGPEQKTPLPLMPPEYYGGSSEEILQQDENVVIKDDNLTKEQKENLAASIINFIKRGAKYITCQRDKNPKKDLQRVVPKTVADDTKK